jgi:hypothetical protein
MQTENAGYIDLMHTLLSNIKISQGTKPISEVINMNEPLKVILCHIVDLIWDSPSDPFSRSSLDLKFSEEIDPKHTSRDETINISPLSAPKSISPKKSPFSVTSSPKKRPKALNNISSSDALTRSSLGSPKNLTKRLSELRCKSGYLDKSKKLSLTSKSDLSLTVISTQSDFCYIKGHCTFSKEKRRINEVKAHSPGPAAYEYEVLNFREKSPRAVIPRGGNRYNFVLNDSPGPSEYYPLRHFISK